MALFFYRAWAGVNANNRQLTPADPIYYTRWGYAALLAITMSVGIILNSVYLFGYLVCPGAMIQVPHVAVIGLVVRDLLVCLIVLPAAIDWLVVGLSSWSGGTGWCGAAIFFDFYLSALYPMILVTLCMILYTRKMPPPLPQSPPHSREGSMRYTSNMSARSGYPLVNQANPNLTYQSQHSHRSRSSTQRPAPQVRPPSVNSNNSNQPVRPGEFRRGFSKTPSREGSMAGSDRGGSAMGRPVRVSLDNRFLSGPQQEFVRNSPMRSSPLRAVEEETGYAASVVGSDLWESASLDYPGREELYMDQDDEFEPEEPRLREWLRWGIPFCYLLALCFGVPAATNMGNDKAPGCYVAADPFKNPYSYVINDPGFNLMMSNVVLNYLVPSVAMIFLSLLLCTTRWTKDGKLNRFYKMCIALCGFFIAARSPVDIIQFTELIHAAQGSRIVNQLPNELEHEILVFWAAILPVVANPIIYLTCNSDYRQNITQAWKQCFGDKKVQKEKYPIDEIDGGGSTQESDVL